MVFVLLRPLPLQDGFRCGRCRCKISLQPLPLQDFVAAVAGAGFCAAVAVPDHMTYESCDESGSHGLLAGGFRFARGSLN